MLSSLRNAANTWVSKGLLLVLVLSFAVWGISGQISGVIGGHANKGLGTYYLSSTIASTIQPSPASR